MSQSERRKRNIENLAFDLMGTGCECRISIWYCLLTPNSDHHLISPHNVTALSSIQENSRENLHCGIRAKGISEITKLNHGIGSRNWSVQRLMVGF